MRTYLDITESKLEEAVIGRSGAAAPVEESHLEIGQLRLQAGYLRLVSIVEAYVDSVASILWTAELGSRDSLFAVLAESAQEKATATWDERKKSLNVHHGILIGTAPSYSFIVGAVVVRNCIAHGLGRLTPRQRNPKDRKAIRDVSVELVDNQVVVSGKSVAGLVSRCVSFVQEVDALVQDRPMRQAE